MDKVILVINNFSWFGKREFRTWLPAVPIITTLLKNTCNFSVLDANVNQWDFDQTEAKLRESGADIVLISALSIDYQVQYHKVAAIAKKALPNCITMMGGVYPTSLPEQVMNDTNIDVIMQGHAEGRLPRIIRMLLDGDVEKTLQEPGIGIRAGDKVAWNLIAAPLYTSDMFVSPDYSLIDVEKYFSLQQNYSAKNYSTECSEKRSINIIASYGCPYNCFFCANRSLSGSHVVYRPVDDVLREIDYFVLEHGVEQISFMDDNIVAKKERAKELFTKLIQRNYHLEIQIGNLAAWDLDDEILQLLRDAGCTRIGISVESGSQRILKEVIHKPLDLRIIPPLVKKFKELGIMMVADFIIGLPGESWKDIRASFDYAYAMDTDLCNFNIAVPYPGTDMYKHMVSTHMLPEDFAFDERFFIAGLVSTDEFRPEELKMLLAYEWERINAGTDERRERAKKVLRLSARELDDYCRQLRESAFRFAKKYGK